MKAIRIYGSSGHATLSLDEVAVPKPATGEILIRVHATAVTPGELEWYPTWHTQKGAPRVHAVPGHEFSGVVEEVGECRLDVSYPKENGAGKVVLRVLTE